MNAEPVTARGLRIGLTAGLIAGATLLTSACAAGQQAQTADQRTTLDGVNKSVGDIHLRGLAIKAPVGSPYYPPGSDAAITVVIVNSGTQQDELTSITTDAASGWASYRSAADAKAVQAAAGSGAASASAGTPTASSTAKPTGAAAKPPQGSQQVVITPGSRVGFAVPTAKGALLLLHTTGKLYPASSVELTFTFARAGTATVAVPVQLSDSPGTATIEAPSGSAADN